MCGNDCWLCKNGIWYIPDSYIETFFVRFDPTQSDANKSVWNKGLEILYISQQKTEY